MRLNAQVAQSIKSTAPSIRLRVRYADLDTLGHVNNSTYFNYLEEARIAFFTHALEIDLEKTKFTDAVVARLEIDYLKPVLYGQAVTIYTLCSRIGNKSLDLVSLICGTGSDGEEFSAAFAKVTMVMFDAQSQRSKAIPERTASALANYLLPAHEDE